MQRQTKINDKNIKSKTPQRSYRLSFYRFQCDLCDAGYVGYTLGHLHTRVDGHKQKAS